MQTTLMKLPTTTRCTTCNSEVFFIPRRGWRDRNGQQCAGKFMTWTAPHLPRR